MTYIPIKFGMSNAGNTSGNTGTVSHQLVLAGGNNITLSGSTNTGGSATITISGGAGGAGGSNTLGISNLGNSAGTSGVISGSALQYALAGGNNITLSQSINASSGTVTISSPNMFNGGLSNLGNTAGTSGTASNQLVWAGGNNITLSQSTAAGGNTITVSAANQSNQTAGIYAVSNTTQSTSATVDARSLSFGGAGAISVGATNGSVVISGPAGGGGLVAGISNIGNTSGTSGTVSNQLVFAGGNNITLSQSTGAGGNTLTVSAPNMFDFGISNIGNTAGTSGTNSNGFVLAGGNNITLSQSTDANGGTITISAGNAGGGITLSTFEPYSMVNTGTAILSANTNTSGGASFVPFVIDEYVSAGTLNLIESVSFVTGGTSSYNQTGSQWWGLYTRGTGTNSTTMSQFTSGSWSWQVSYNNSTITFSVPNATSTTGYGYTSATSAGLKVSSSFTGLKIIQLPVSSLFSPGNYWLGLHDRASSSSFNSGLRLSYYGINFSLTGLAPFGSFSSSYTSGTNLLAGSGNWMQGFGSYKVAGLTSLPPTMTFSALSQNLTGIPYMKLIST